MTDMATTQLQLAKPARNADPVITRIMAMADPSRPEAYRRYLSGLTRERLSALAIALEEDTHRPATLPKRWWRGRNIRPN
jgi:hypothetical protein